MQKTIWPELIITRLQRRQISDTYFQLQVVIVTLRFRLQICFVGVYDDENLSSRFTKQKSSVEPQVARQLYQDYVTNQGGEVLSRRQLVFPFFCAYFLFQSMTSKTSLTFLRISLVQILQLVEGRLECLQFHVKLGFLFDFTYTLFTVESFFVYLFCICFGNTFIFFDIQAIRVLHDNYLLPKRRKDILLLNLLSIVDFTQKHLFQIFFHSRIKSLCKILCPH